MRRRLRPYLPWTPVVTFRTEQQLRRLIRETHRHADYCRTEPFGNHGYDPRFFAADVSRLTRTVSNHCYAEGATVMMEPEFWKYRDMADS